MRLRINRVVPLHIPVLSHLLGPFRYEGYFGSLKDTVTQRAVDPRGEIQLQAEQERGIRLFPGRHFRGKGSCASHFWLVLE